MNKYLSEPVRLLGWPIVIIILIVIARMTVEYDLAALAAPALAPTESRVFVWIEAGPIRTSRNGWCTWYIIEEKDNDPDRQRIIQGELICSAGAPPAALPDEGEAWGLYDLH